MACASADFRIIPGEGLIQSYARQLVPSASDFARLQFALVHESLAATSSVVTPNLTQ